MSAVILLHKTSRLKFDFADIERPGSDLHVVTLRQGGIALTPEQRAFVTQVHHADSWTFEEVLSVVQPMVDVLDEVVVVTHDEYSMLFAAELRETFGLPGPKVEQILRFTKKTEMKRLVAAAGVRVPRWITVRDVMHHQELGARADSIIAVTGLPAFVKEIAGTCSEGARRLDTKDQLVQWLGEDGVAHLDFEVDEFLSGELVHVDCVVQGGQVVHAQTSLDTFPNAETITDRPLGSMTIPPESALGARMLSFNDQVLSALAPLIEGTTHLEMFWTPRDELVFLEIAARSPGGDCPRAFEVQSGINYQSVFFQLQLGIPVSLSPQKGPWVAWCWYPWRSGRISGIHHPAINGDVECKHAASVGDVTALGASTRNRSAKVFVSNPDFDELSRDFDYLRYAFEPFSYEDE